MKVFMWLEINVDGIVSRKGGRQEVKVKATTPNALTQEAQEMFSRLQPSNSLTYKQ